MRKMRVGSEEMPVAFTTWTVNEFYKITGINLYDPSGITKVFKKYEGDEVITPTDFEIVAKLAYCALAAGCMPEDADDDWKPKFTWRSIMNRYKLGDSFIYDDLLSAYFDRDIEIVKDGLEAAKHEVPKNEEAPTQGQ